MSPLLVSVPTAAKSLGIGQTLAHQLVASGQLPTVTIGRRRLVHVQDLEHFAEQLRSRRDPAVVRDVAS